MARDPIVFAMANPTPEIMPDVAAPVRRRHRDRAARTFPIRSTTCSRFRGSSAARSTAARERITEGMKLAAAQRDRRASSPRPSASPEYVIPSVFDTRVVDAVAKAVATAAVEEGVARRQLMVAEGEEIAAPV